MHAIKGGWVGQTFALATYNDSGGRKSRIRRSKEERKAMAESFIKKYQNLNNGSFPSLNLTHKEVGGSFYTVREIVREIIQENRVLGPANLPPEKQTNDKLLEEFPLGSISIEPQPHLSSLEDMHITSHVSPSQYHGGSEEHVLNSNGQCHVPEHQRLELDSELVVNGNFAAVNVDLKYDEQHRTRVASDHCEGSNTEQLSVFVEQFLQPEHQNLNNVETGSGSETTEEDEECNEPILVSPMPMHHQTIRPEHDKESNEEHVLHSGGEFPGNGHLECNSDEAANDVGQEIEKTTEFGEPMHIRAVALADSLDAEKVQSKEMEASKFGRTCVKADVVVADSLEAEKDQIKELEASKSGRTGMKADAVVEKFPLRPVAKIIHGLDGKLDEETANPKTLEQVIKHDRKSVLDNSSDLMNVEVGSGQVSQTLTKMSEPGDEKSALYNGNPMSEKPVNAPSGISHENLNSINPNVYNEHSVPDETTASKNKVNIQHDRSNKKESSSTLDRISLGTWEETPAKPAESETNPLFALFKAFITAFMKFWTE